MITVEAGASHNLAVQVVQVLNLVGLPTVLGWVLYDRRKIKNEAEKGELENVEVAETLPNRVKSSSIVTLEAELMALTNSFNTDRKIKEETIGWLKSELDKEREESRRKDAIIDGLQRQITKLKKEVQTISDNLDEVQRNLDVARGQFGTDKGGKK